MIINEYIESLRTLISSSPIVLTYSFTYYTLSIYRTLIEISIVFIDESQLRIVEAINVQRNKLEKEKYRYHYMDKNNQIIFRYDNAPHYPKLKTFPHHKHLPKKVVESMPPNLKDVIKEIEKVLIKNLKII